MSRVVITGASGFVGRHLRDALNAEGHCVISTTRASSGPDSLVFNLEKPEEVRIGHLENIDCIYHLAARVHVMRAGSEDEEKFRCLNVHATQVLAQTAAAAGVKRFVYLSSIKVNGERTPLGKPFASHDQPAPQDAYGRSKWEAEQALMHVARDSGLEVVIVRPPLIYGPGVGANFRRLLALVDKGWPLPFASLDNRRSLVSIWNLVSLLLLVRNSPHAPGKTWLVSDGDDMSTPRLLRTIAGALRRNLRLMPVPARVLRSISTIVGRQAEAGRLIDSLQVDISETCSGLNWKPPEGVDDGIRRTVQWFRESHRAMG